MGSAIRSISGAVDNLSHGNIAGAVGQSVGLPIGMTGDALRAVGAGPTLDKLDGSNQDSSPEAPGVNSDLAALHNKQVENAKYFRSDMPRMQHYMGENLKAAGNQQLSGQQQGITANDSSRGLLYGGVHAGGMAGARASMASKVASGTADINSGLINQADALDAQTLQTGAQIQQTQQTIQNQLYSQAMAKMNASNQMTGGLLSSGLMAAAIMA